METIRIRDPGSSIRNTADSTLYCSVVDPDPHDLHWLWSAGSGSALGIHIRIQEGNNDPKKKKK